VGVVENSSHTLRAASHVSQNGLTKQKFASSGPVVFDQPAVHKVDEIPLLTEL
jgi:hypothetical protein